MELLRTWPTRCKGTFRCKQARTPTPRNGGSLERQVAEIKQGLYDKFFDQLARTVEIEPTFGGTAGGETDRSTARDRRENRAFSKDQVY